MDVGRKSINNNTTSSRQSTASSEAYVVQSMSLAGSTTLCGRSGEERKNEWISCPVRQQRKTLTFNVAPGPENWQMWRTLNEGRKLQASLTHRPLILLTQIDWDTGKTIWGFLDGGGKGKGEREEISRLLDFPSRMTQHDISIHCRLLSAISELDFDVFSSFGFIDLYCKVRDCNHN